MTIIRRNVMLAFVSIVVMIHLLNLVALYARYIAEKNPIWKLTYELISVSSEGKIPTAYSALSLLICSVLLFFIGIHTFSKYQKRELSWYALGVIFFMMAFDEGFALHEYFSYPVRQILNIESGFLYHGWVVAGFIVVAIIGLSFTKFFFSLVTQTRMWFGAACFVYLGGVLGMEMIGASYVSLQGRDLTYGIIATIEEVLEMSGILIFLNGLLLHLEREKAHIDLKFNLENKT